MPLRDDKTGVSRYRGRAAPARSAASKGPYAGGSLRGPVSGEASRGSAATGALLAALLSFVGAITLGNAPYLFFGYGLSAFAVFAVGLTCRPGSRVGFVVGLVLGIGVDLTSQSVFLFVGLGAIVVRLLQFFLLVRLRRRLGDLAASLVVLLVGVFLAIAVGLITYGGEGIQPAFAVFDVVYLAPAWMLARIRAARLPRLEGIGLSTLVVAATLVAFASASAFLLAAPFVASLVALTLVGALVFRRRGPLPMTKRTSVDRVAPFAITAVLVAFFLISGAAAGYSLRAQVYPLYPDSLAARQWIQTSDAAGCRGGDLAGGRTETNGVWSPARLRVLSTCVTVSGTIQALTPTSGPAVDGDYGIDIRVDAGYEWTLSLGSYVLNDGNLHVEVVPSDQAAVLGNLTLVPGAHVQVTGAWVLDTDHGWTSEIHPAWSIVLLP